MSVHMCRGGGSNAKAQQPRKQGIGAFFSVQNGNGPSQALAKAPLSQSKGSSSSASRKDFFAPRRSRGS